VRALVGLDADQRVPDAPAVVDEPPLRAIAGVGRFNAFVVAKILEVFVNEGLRLQLFEAVCFRAWVFWELALIIINYQLDFSQEEVSTALAIGSTPPPNCPRLLLYNFYVYDLYMYIFLKIFD
jgi:hypothetical protein